MKHIIMYTCFKATLQIQTTVFNNNQTFWVPVTESNSQGILDYICISFYLVVNQYKCT